MPKKSKNNVVTLVSCWLNTAAANIFKTIEIPFVLFFLTHSLNRELDVAKLSIFLSSITLSSSILIPLATPTAAGTSPIYMKRLLASTLTLSYLIVFVSSLLLFVSFDGASFLLKDFLLHLLLVTIAVSVIAIRRILQGTLLFLKKSYAITLASFFRVFITVTLCITLPASFSYFGFAAAILITGAIVETALVFAFYFLNRAEKYSEQSFYVALKGYIPIAALPLAIQIQSYALSFFILRFYGRENLALWLVVYSFIAILSGINLEIDNIILRYKSYLKKYLFLLAPLVTIFILIYLFLINNFISYKYFVEFQGITKIEDVVSLSYMIGILGIFIVAQQALKGYVLISQKLSIAGKTSIIGVLVIILTALLMRETFSNTTKMPLLALLLSLFAQNIYMAAQLYYLSNKKRKKKRMKSSDFFIKSIF